MVFAGIVQDICGESCDAGETILGLALILGGCFALLYFLYALFNE